jgi:hypothetical protein
VTILSDIAFVTGIFCLITVVRLCWPFQVEANDLTNLVAGGRRYRVYTFTGSVTNYTRTATTQVTDDRAITGNFDQWGGTIRTTGSLRSKTTVHVQFFLAAEPGNTHSVQVNDLSLPVGDGQLVSVAWAIRKGRKRGQYFIYRNHTTNQVVYDPGTMRALIYGSKRPSIRFSLLALALALPTYGVSFAVLFPVLLGGWLTGRARIATFGHGGGESLITSLDAQAKAARPKVELANEAEDLTKLSTLAKDGLLTSDEWTRAKDLYLSKGESAQDLAIANLKQIYDLYKQGVLSESEFNSKKWEILARESQAHH